MNDREYATAENALMYAPNGASVRKSEFGYEWFIPGENAPLMMRCEWCKALLNEDDYDDHLASDFNLSSGLTAAIRNNNPDLYDRAWQAHRNRIIELNGNRDG